MSTQASRLPRQISPTNPVLASAIPLSHTSRIIYACFTLSHDTRKSDAPTLLDRARRKFFLKTASVDLSQAWLPHTTLPRQANPGSLWIFRIVHNESSQTLEELQQIDFEGLTLSELSEFNPRELYPCSDRCSSLRKPCSICLDPHGGSSPPILNLRTQSNVKNCTARLPREPLRTAYIMFLESVKSRLIDDISQLNAPGSSDSKGKRKPHRKVARRLKNGFLMGDADVAPHTQDEWGADWKSTLNRPLIYVHLKMHASVDRITIQPIVRPTAFLPLVPLLDLKSPRHSASSHPQSSPSLEPLTPYPNHALTSGSPIVLLPFGTPAYFLSRYTGPGSGVTRLFSESLTGLGAGVWKMDGDAAKFIVAWVHVENKNGEDKGIPVIWPAWLCVGFMASTSSGSKSSHARTVLRDIPDLPTQLRATPSGNGPSWSEASSRRPFPRTPTSESVRAFRALTVNCRAAGGIEDVAAEVGEFVDAIARERERERERLRREREGGVNVHPKQGEVVPKLQSSTVLDEVPPRPNDAAKRVVLNHAEITSLNVYPTPPVATPLGASVVSAVLDSSETSGARGPPSPEPSSPNKQALAPEATSLPVSNLDVKTIPLSRTPPGGSSFDAFEAVDASWSQNGNAGLMELGMEYGMGIGLSMGMNFGSSLGMDGITGGTSGGNSGMMGYDRTSTGMDMEFGDDAFTDDDFSFFDQPTRLMPPPPPLLDHSLGQVPQDTIVFSPSVPLFSVTSPWTTNVLAEGFTPKFSDAHDGGIPSVPDLLSPSPGPTPHPQAYSVSVTPAIEESEWIRSRAHYGDAKHGFDSIKFPVSHRIADGKYAAAGKFALSLPTPPDEEERATPMDFAPEPLDESFKPKGLRFRYNAATDPRFGLVKKLIGVKRKSVDQGVRETQLRWQKEHEEWDTNPVGVPAPNDVEVNDIESEEEEDEGEESSQPSTPPPSYLPLGPTLPQTHFQHSFLLPLSNPLRPPGSAVAPTNISASAAAMASVPTPVSPAATLGMASEKSKSLEAAAYAVAREVVDNPVWAESWKAHAIGSGSTKRGSAEIWQSDIQDIHHLLESVAGLESRISLQDFLDLGPDDDKARSRKIALLQPPMVSVAKGEAVLQLLPTAVRFWEKLGLGPKGGKKDITAFVLFEDTGEAKLKQVESWLTSISRSYTGKYLGSHSAGKHNCVVEGLVPIQFEAFLNFVSGLPAFQTSVVFYVVTPLATMSLSSPILRQVFSAFKRAAKLYTKAVIYYQLVPEEAVLGPTERTVSKDFSDKDWLCWSIYNKILVSVDRQISRQFFDNGERITSLIEEPAITLARSARTKVKFFSRGLSKSLDVMDRNTLLHVGYQVSQCGKWILAACVDQRGEAHELGIWLTESEQTETLLVEKIWNFAQHFAQKGNVEWRIAIAKLGVMSAAELNAWITHLESGLNANRDLLTHVSILSVDPEVPLAFLSRLQTSTPPAHPRSSSKASSGPIFIDSACDTYAIFPQTPQPIPPCSSISPQDFGADASYVLDSEDQPEREYLSLLPLTSSTLVRVPSDESQDSISMLFIHLLHTASSPYVPFARDDQETHIDITYNYHELAVLGSLRWRLNVDPILPFHLGAVSAMGVALGRDFFADI